MLAALHSLVVLLSDFIPLLLKMKNDRSNKNSRAHKCFSVPKSSLIVQNASQTHSSNMYDKNTLERVLKHLSKLKKKPKVPVKEHCPVEDSTEDRIDHQVKLHCRQLTTVVQELRRTIMRQDWDDVTTLLLILCHPGLKYYSSIIIRACFILLCNHPSSDLQLLKNFIRQMTEYILEEDVNKFIRILFALKKSGLDSSERGKYKRNTGDNKITMDPEFEQL